MVVVGAGIILTAAVFILDDMRQTNILLLQNTILRGMPPPLTTKPLLHSPQPRTRHLHNTLSNGPTLKTRTNLSRMLVLRQVRRQHLILKLRGFVWCQGLQDVGDPRQGVDGVAAVVDVCGLAIRKIFFVDGWGWSGDLEGWQGGLLGEEDGVCHWFF